MVSDGVASGTTAAERAVNHEPPDTAETSSTAREAEEPSSNDHSPPIARHTPRRRIASIAFLVFGLLVATYLGPRVVAHELRLPNGEYRLDIEVDTRDGRRAVQRRVTLEGGSTQVDVSTALTREDKPR